MKKKIKISFSKLIDQYKYDLEEKMNILDWMLKTGKGHDHSYGWYVDGINKSLFGYSANNYDHPCRLPRDNYEGCFDMFFDAVFARAIFSPENNSLKSWREEENIYPGKFRMLKFEPSTHTYGEDSIYSLIHKIYNLECKILKKKHHHPEYKNRTLPKIIDISIYTVGNGWIVEYQFSFKEFNYEPGWTNGYIQQENESVYNFLKYSLTKINSIIDKRFGNNEE